MTTTAQLESALKDAMRSRDEVRKRTLRMTLSAIRLVEIDKGKPLDEQGILAVLQKEVKSRQEAISEAQHAGRPELQAEAEAEIQVLENYLPQQLSDEELETLAKQAIAEVGATSAREMGQVMQVLVPRLQGRASGGQASQAVRKLLESS
jgi:uncharacterized protein YqeY